MKKCLVFVIQLCSIIVVISDEGNELPAPPLCGINPLNNRIIGGKVLSLDEHPWMALLDFELNLYGAISTDYQCGGSLINSRYVITAAHCLSEKAEQIKRKLIAIRLGEHDLLQFPVDCEVDENSGDKICAAEPIDYEIEKIIPHPQYNTITKSNDIALIRLVKPVEYTDSIKPVCLPTETTTEVKTNETLYAIGWGSTDPTNIADSTSSVKRIIGLRSWNLDECISKFKVQSIQICAGGETNLDACIGDSGGPLLNDISQFWYLEGVISYGNGCGKPGWPGVYTNVRSYLEWIRLNLEP